MNPGSVFGSESSTDEIKKELSLKHKSRMCEQSGRFVQDHENIDG